MSKIHDFIAEAIKEHKGQILSYTQIRELVLRKFSNTVELSVVVKDHAKPWYPKASNCSICVNSESKRLLDWLGKGRYMVRHYK